MRRFRNLLSDRSGATAIEYSIIGTLIAVAIIGGATALGNGVTNTFDTVGDTFEEVVK